MFKISKLGVESLLPFMCGSSQIPIVEICVEYWNCLQILNHWVLFNFQPKQSVLKEVRIILIEL